MILKTFDINNLTPELYDYWYNIMSDIKKEKVNKLKLEDAKKSTVAGEMLVRETLCEMFNISNTEISFCYNSQGKPYVENYNIFFNISHSHNMVICGISEKEIGVDIEKIRPVNLNVAKKVCLENELDYIFGKNNRDYNSDSEIYIKRFFEIWTGKEAYFKCTGTGITDFKSVDTLNNKSIHLPIYKDNFIIRTATMD